MLDGDLSSSLWSMAVLRGHHHLERDILRVMRQRGSPERDRWQDDEPPGAQCHGRHRLPAGLHRAAAHLDIRRIVVTDEAGLPLGIVNEIRLPQIPRP